MKAPAKGSKKAVMATRQSPKVRKIPDDGITRMFVLDTNVLMHDPTALFRFEEHDIYLPMVTLEELDNNKKGITEAARNARQASRNLEEIIATNLGEPDHGCPLSIQGNKHVTGRLFLQTDVVNYVPAAAVIRRVQALIGITGRKACAGGDVRQR